MKTVSYISLGCPKNLVDTQKIAALSDYGRIVPEKSNADTVFLSTCAFIGPARKESLNHIRRLALKYRAGRLKKIRVYGCLVDLESEKLKEKYPFIEFIRSEHFLLSDKSERVFSDPYFAYLKISEGCSRSCSYCLIPRIKGPFLPYPEKVLERQVEEIAERGVPEIIIVSHSTADYPFAALKRIIKRIIRNPAIKWLRLLYLNPDRLTDGFMDLFDMDDKVLKYFDLPFQHPDDRILKKMGRAGNRKKYINLAGALKARFPEAVIRSSFITGFPGEDVKAFNLLKAFVEDGPVDYPGIFAYSGYKGLPSEKLPGSVSPEEIKKRVTTLSRCALKRIKEFNKTVTGQSAEALPVAGRKGVFRTWFQAPEIDGITNTCNREAGASQGLATTEIRVGASPGVVPSGTPAGVATTEITVPVPGRVKITGFNEADLYGDIV